MMLTLLSCASGDWSEQGTDLPEHADASDSAVDSGGETDADTDADADTDTDIDTDTDTGAMVADVDQPYVGQDAMRLKGVQPDFWANQDEISGNNAGSVAMNLVWASWQPAQSVPPCAADQVAYDGACFTPDAAVESAIAAWTSRGVAVSAIVYGVPEWARTGRACSPAAAGFEIFCAPDNAADYARFAGMLARRYNGANGVGTVADFVIHNEVNSNTWFDIGCGQGVECDQATWLATYADNYVQAFDAIRAEQSAAKVFVSLDHHFASPDYDQPTAYDALLSGEAVLTAVATAAGTRDWRVAYHPYAPDLLSPTFSADDWPRVTYGNIGALPGWLYANWPGSAAATDIHLTESGINSLSPSSEADQAIAVCDTFVNVLGTPGISRYIYHRMQDHLDETASGLGVGLWSDAGVAKSAWAIWALANRDDLDPVQLSCGFERLPYTVLTRSYDPARGHWASSRLPPASFGAEAEWSLWRDEQPDSTLLFECAVGEHNLLTPGSDCEGLQPLGPVGWINTLPGAGTTALYRCYVPSSGDHFISSDSNCEGQTVERLLGYAME